MSTCKLMGGLSCGLISGYSIYSSAAQLNAQIPLQEEKAEKTINDQIENKKVEVKKNEPIVENTKKMPVVIPDVKPTDDTEMFNRLREHQIGYRFKDYLIGSKNNNEVWNKKMSNWIYNLGDDGGERWVTPPFRTKLSKEKINTKMLQTKCERAYEKSNWNEAFLFDRQRINTKFQNTQYWSDVWDYCGRENIDMPADWPK